MDFSPINRLRLKGAFGDLQKFQELTCDMDFLRELFEWTDRGVIFVHDDDVKGHSVFITDTNGVGADKTFRIGNLQHKDLFLWHIDGVLYSKNSKCDCAFLTGENIGFVEFKSNAVNNTESAIKGNYEKPSSQLKLTIMDVAERCASVGVDIMDALAVEAFAVFNRTVPKHNAYQKKFSGSISFRDRRCAPVFRE